MLPGSWMGPDPSKAATEQPITSQKRSALSTEYKLKFRPFSDYSYVDGHFSGAQDTTDGENGGARAASATPWFEEVVELRKKASSYKVRGWGREMAEPHLAHLYDRVEDPSLLAERKIISALYLETFKTGFTRSEERGRSPVTTGGASVRQQSQPPISSRKSPGAAKMALKLHTAEGARRPHSAQAATDPQQGDVVDRAKGRSPATQRTPTSSRPGVSPATHVPPARVKAKRPATATAATTDKPDRPPKPEKTEKTPRQPPQAAAAGGTPDSTAGGKGIRGGPRTGGTPRSRSAHRLASSAKSPTKAEKPSKAMTTSTPESVAADTKRKSATPPKEKPQAERKPVQVKEAPPPQTKEAPPSQTKEAPPPADAKQTPPQAEVKPAQPEVKPETPAEARQEEVVRSAPEPTRVKSPETLMGPIKSPEPVNWTVPLDTGKTFTVTQNVMAGHDSPHSSRGDSLRSPGEEGVRSPYQRAVTDVSHLRNGEPTPTESPLLNDLPPASNGHDLQTRHPDPMTASITGQDLQRSFHEAADPMTASMTGEDLQRSFHAPDPMAVSMTGEDLQRSFHADPMSGSMTGDDLKRSFHAAADPMSGSFHAAADPMSGSFHAAVDPMSGSFHAAVDPMSGSFHAAVDPMSGSFHVAADPMAASMTGEDLQRSFHEDVPAPVSTLPGGTRVLDDPLMGTGYGRATEPASSLFSSGSAEPASLFSSGSAQPSEPASKLFSSGSAEPASSLFSSGSAGPARFSHELFGSGRPAEAKSEAPEKPTYRVI